MRTQQVSAAAKGHTRMSTRMEGHVTLRNGEDMHMHKGPRKQIHVSEEERKRGGEERRGRRRREGVSVCGGRHLLERLDHQCRLASSSLD